MSNKKIQVTMEVDLEESALTIENVIAALTVSDRKRIAEEIVKEWVKQPTTKEQTSLVAAVHNEVTNIAQAQVNEIIREDERMQDIASSVAISVIDRIPELAQTVINNWFRQELQHRMQEVISPESPYSLQQDFREIKERLGIS